MVPNLVVVTLVLTACLWDLRTRRIPNLLTVGAAAAGFGFAAVMHGLPGLSLSVTGWLVAVLLYLPFFALRGLGAADVKLLGAVGAWLGPGGAVAVGFFTAIAGGIMALAVVIVHGYFAESLRNIWTMVMHWRVFGLRPVPGVTIQTTRGPRLAYAVPIAAGTLVTLWMR